MIVAVDVKTQDVISVLDWAVEVSDVTMLPQDVVALDADEFVEVGWKREGERFVPPDHPCVQYDWTDHRFYRHRDYRRILHERTSNDTLQALRKIREGDTSIDWQAWLDKLDAYNVAVEKTKEQADYPQKVVYPEYPTKP